MNYTDIKLTLSNSGSQHIKAIGTHLWKSSLDAPSPFDRRSKPVPFLKLIYHTLCPTLPPIPIWSCQFSFTDHYLSLERPKLLYPTIESSIVRASLLSKRLPKLRHTQLTFFQRTGRVLASGVGQSHVMDAFGFQLEFFFNLGFIQPARSTPQRRS